MSMTTLRHLEVLAATAKARLCLLPNGQEMWIPTSQCRQLRDAEEGDELHYVAIPTWLLEKNGYQQEAKPPVPVPMSQITDDHKALFVLPGAPMSVIRAAYKAMCLMHHPDLGGDVNMMKKINRAFEHLTGGRP